MAALVALAGCNDFSFFSTLGALTVAPAQATVAPNGTVAFRATGGKPPYTFTVSGFGVIDPETGYYKAPAAACIDTIRVEDRGGLSSTATITISGGVALAISPPSASVAAGGTLTFVGVGGVPPYSFTWGTNNSGGTLAGDLYTAGSSTGVTDTVVVTDSDTPAQTDTATINVTDMVTNVDYRVIADTFPASALAGETISGEFTIQNNGTAGGGSAVSWWLFASSDGSFGGGGETMLASGNTGFLAASATVDITPAPGDWPSVQASRTLFVMISAKDDLNTANNVYESGSITLSFPDVDYQPSAVADLDLTPRTGETIDAQFTLENVGADDGTQPVTWKVYASADTVVGDGDTLVDSSTTEPFAAAGDSRTVTVGGIWPGEPDQYYLIVQVSSADDTAADNTGNNEARTAAAIDVTERNVNYAVSNVQHLTGDVLARTVTGSFQLDNIGTEDGTTTLSWWVYASANTSIDAADTVVAFRTDEPLMTAAELPRTVGFSGTWPASGVSYYLIVRVAAPDEISTGTANDTNNTAAAVPVHVADVDHDFTADPTSSIISTMIEVAGNDLSGQFTLRNNGADDAAQTVEWSVYVSKDTTLSAEDWFVQGGTTPSPLGSGDTVDTSFVGSWPADPVGYYLLVRVVSSEDVAAGKNGNNTGSSAMITVVAPSVDYTVFNVQRTGGTLVPGGSVTGSFQYSNVGAQDGARALSWAAYASTNPTLDPGDPMVASGQDLPPLDAGAGPGAVPFSGFWPLDFGTYYLIVEVTSLDPDSNPGPTSNTKASGTTANVGVYDEVAYELVQDDGDCVGMVHVYDLNVTLRPGMSLRVMGSMDSADIDDVMAFNTGSAAVVTFSIRLTGNGKEVALFRYRAPNTYYTPAYLTANGELAINWIVGGTGDAGVVRWIDVFNDTPRFVGTYELIIVAY